MIALLRFLFGRRVKTPRLPHPERLSLSGAIYRYNAD